MFTAIHPSGARILSFDTENRGQRYLCPYCHEQVYLRKDRTLNVRRFFHSDSSDKCCQLKWREDKAFYHCQLNMFAALRDAGMEVIIDAKIQPNERMFSPLMVKLKDTWVGIEIESPLLSHDSINRVHKITKYYGKNNIPVLWVLLDGICDSRTLYTIKSHEQKIAHLQDNFLLFWRGGSMLTLCHIYPHRYTPTKQKRQAATTVVYKRVVRLVFAPFDIPLHSLVYKSVQIDGIVSKVAVSRVMYAWPLLEKPEPF